MKCTGCGKDRKYLHGERWNSAMGYIIRKDEYLCDRCAGKRPGFLLPGDLLRLAEKKYGDYTTEENDKGTIKRRDDKGRLHSLFSPALEDANGDKYWAKNGKQHREDGPAVEAADGVKCWYLNGEFIGKNTWGFTDEKFEQYKKREVVS